MSWISYPPKQLPNDLNVNSVTASSGFTGSFYGDGSGLVNIQVETSGNLTGSGLSSDKIRLKDDISLTSITASSLLINGTASINILNTVVSNNLQIGDKYITILSGANNQIDLDGAGILFGSGSSTPAADQDSLAHIVYRDSTDHIEIKPGLDVIGAVSSSGGFTGSFSGSFTGDSPVLTTGNITGSGLLGNEITLKDDITINSAKINHHLIVGEENIGYQIGTGSVAIGFYTQASGNYSHAEGYQTIAYGIYSHAQGQGSKAYEYCSHAEGADTETHADNSHTEGLFTKAYEEASHAEGIGSETYGSFSHAEGEYTKAYGSNSHTEGRLTKTYGYASHAEGQETITSGSFSHTEGVGTVTSGTGSHAEGDKSVANGDYSHAEGSGSITDGQYSHAEGENTSTNGQSSHSEGLYSQANGNYSHAEGWNGIANGDYSHAEGKGNISHGTGSHAEGVSTQAIGYCSHTEGWSTLAYNTGSHAEGYQTTAYGLGSHTEGLWTIASASYQHAQGRYNQTSSTALMIVGDGDSEETRHNILEVYSGSVVVSGSLKNTGGLVISTKRVTSNYTITTSSDHVVAFSGSNLTASLPSAIENVGSTFVIKNNHTSNLHITSSVAGLIDGSTYAVIDRQYNSYKIVSDGTDWLVI